VAPYGAVELGYWLRLAALAALLAFAMYRARQRWLNGEPGDQSRAILLAWLAVMTGFSLYVGLLAVFFAPIAIFYVVAVVAVFVAVPALVTIAIFDVGARLLQADRTGFWLGAALVGFVAATFLWLGLLGAGPLLLLPGLWLEWLALASVPAAGALVWWSFLPDRSGDSISKAFE
jgi:hypothetical protein